MLGEYGIVGLAALTSMVLLPAVLMWRRVPTAKLARSGVRAPVALAVVITLYMIDGLFNATFNPVACLAVGAVASIAIVAQSRLLQQAHRRLRLSATRIGRRFVGEGPPVRKRVSTLRCGPASPSPGTPGEGWGEGLQIRHPWRTERYPRQTLTLPSPGVPGEGNSGSARHSNPSITGSTAASGT